MSQTVVVEVDVDLRPIVDSTDLGAHGLLDTTAQELTGDWIGCQQRGQIGPRVVLTAPTGIAPTQLLGRELFHEPDVEGIKVISARVAVTCCLVVFTHKLQRPGSLTWDDRNIGNRELPLIPSSRRTLCWNFGEGTGWQGHNDRHLQIRLCHH